MQTQIEAQIYGLNVFDEVDCSGYAVTFTLPAQRAEFDAYVSDLLAKSTAPPAGVTCDQYIRINLSHS